MIAVESEEVRYRILRRISLLLSCYDSDYLESKNIVEVARNTSHVIDTYFDMLVKDAGLISGIKFNKHVSEDGPTLITDVEKIQSERKHLYHFTYDRLKSMIDPNHSAVNFKRLKMTPFELSINTETGQFEMIEILNQKELDSNLKVKIKIPDQSDKKQACDAARLVLKSVDDIKKQEQFIQNEEEAVEALVKDMQKEMPDSPLLNKENLHHVHQLVRTVSDHVSANIHICNALIKLADNIVYFVTLSNRLPHPVTA